MRPSAIQFVQEFVVDAHGWKYDTPNVHEMQDATANFLEELRKEKIALDEDNSYDVSREHAAIAAAL